MSNLSQLEQVKEEKIADEERTRMKMRKEN